MIYPDWLVLSARLLVQPSCGQVKIVLQIYIFGRVPLWLCEDITAYCYMYCYFRNIFPPWSSQMTILLITYAMYHIRYTKGEYEFKRKKTKNPRIGYCSEIRGRSRRHRIAFNSLYLFSSKSINYEANGEALHNYTRGEGPSAVLPQGGASRYLAPISLFVSLGNIREAWPP